MSASRPVHRGVQEQKQHVQKDNQRGCPRHALGDSLKLLRGGFSPPRRTRARRRRIVVVIVISTALSKREHLLLRRREHVAIYPSFSFQEKRISLRINLLNSSRKEKAAHLCLFCFCCSVQERVLLLVQGRKTPRELTVVVVVIFFLSVSVYEEI